MTPDDVLAVVDAPADAGVPVWLDGGWGVDALVGRQTRPHRDVDLALDVRQEPQALTALRGLAFEIETDWRPTRVELAAPGSRWVDLHPLAFQRNGDGIQAGPAGERYVHQRRPAVAVPPGLRAARRRPARPRSAARPGRRRSSRLIRVPHRSVNGSRQVRQRHGLARPVR